jgi:hypothetical protein
VHQASHTQAGNQVTENYPCSRVFDKDIHSQHSYYYGGHDVVCLGYSPTREHNSDLAETPEQYYGVEEINRIFKDQMILSEEEVALIEEVLLEEELIVLEDSYGDEIRSLFFSGSTREDLAQRFNTSVGLIDHVIYSAKLEKLADDIMVVASAMPVHEPTIDQRIVFWFNSLRPGVQNVLVVLAVVVIFTVVSFVFNTLQFGG